MRTRLRCRVLLWGLSLFITASGAANAESALRLEWPATLGTLSATTFDTNRVAVGAAHVMIERLDDGNVRMRSDSGFAEGARTVVSALLEPVDAGRSLRPVHQESRSFDEERQPLGRLEVNHRERMARCYTPELKKSGEIALPENDRVANMTLSFLFLPLVRKEREKLDFQIFLCGLGMRVVDFDAVLAPESRDGAKPHLVEVRYGPDLGLANFIAPAFLPKLSFWYAREAPHSWMAHRLPLYGRGPVVFVVRDGVPLDWLGER